MIRRLLARIRDRLMGCTPAQIKRRRDRTRHFTK